MKLVKEDDMRKNLVWGGTISIPIGLILMMMTNPSVNQLGLPLFGIGIVALLVGAIMNVQHGNRQKEK